MFVDILVLENWNLLQRLNSLKKIIMFDVLWTKIFGHSFSLPSEIPEISTNNRYPHFTAYVKIKDYDITQEYPELNFYIFLVISE